MQKLTQLSLRQKAVFIPAEAMVAEGKTLSETTSVLVANLAKLGYGVSEPLLQALNQTSPKFKLSLLDIFREVMGVNKNWTPLVKGWDVPTGESLTDHIMTFFANMFQAKGTGMPATGTPAAKLACGHIIPADTFPLERYNGCPFCGTPFEFGEIENYGQGSKLKQLELWTEADVEKFFISLLTSKTALDATQIDSLKMVLSELPLPKVEIAMKETLMTVIELLVESNQTEEAQKLFKTPNDILN
jgi:hypothetical protein